MTDSITLITCTGGRPEAFSICEKLMEKQTIWEEDVSCQWVVVDDCAPKTKCSLSQEYYPGPRPWQEGVNTHRFNMELACEKVKGDFVFIIEDDDWYRADYLETFYSILKQVSIVGEAHARYYHVQIPGSKRLPNVSHAALSQTAFRAEVGIPLMKKAVNSGELYFDSVLWNLVKEQSIPRSLLVDSGLSVGIKGMPGRAGITPGHREKKDYMYDSGQVILKKWLGDDSALYMPFIGGTKNATNR